MTRTLAELRQEIDEIDARLHDLIMQRSSVVESIRAVKPGGPAIRPARQAQILRSLIDRHHGSLPKRRIVAVWRELLGAFTASQGDFTVSVSAGLADLARRDYGDAANIRIDSMPLQAVWAGSAMLAILPWPSQQQGWWRDLAAMENPPAIVATLPFTGVPEAVAIGKIPFEPSGDDYSLIATADSQCTFDSADLIAQSADTRLLRVPYYVSPDDMKLDKRTFLLGGYPKPLEGV